TWSHVGANAPLEVRTTSLGRLSILRLATRSKSALDRALSEFRDFYQLFEIDVQTDEVEPRWERQRLPGPNIDLEQIVNVGPIRTLRVSATVPQLNVNMLQAHRLLNADIILDILRHHWTPAWTQSLGWRLTAHPLEDPNWTML